MTKSIYFLLTLFIYTNLIGQGSYAPDAGQVGTTAIYKDSSAIVNWASSCEVTRGWQNCLDTTLGKASSGSAVNATGKSGQNGTVSLGDNGEAILSFDHPIMNGNGPDFAVFENGFNHTFLELAFVEVSTNGIDYVRFPAYSETQTTTQINGFEELNPTYIHNLAGKYKVGYGTPFDLEDLIDSTSIDVNNINYVKVIDVIGILNHPLTSLDVNSNPINDPFPTPFPTSGFDLDAVGVLHQFVGIEKNMELEAIIYPNPSNGNFTIEYNNQALKEINITNSLGQTLLNETTTANRKEFNEYLLPGVYLLKTTINGKTSFKKVIIQ